MTSRSCRYNFDVCNWHLVISNLTEYVLQVLSDTFTMDFQRTLKFQNIPEEMDIQPQQAAKSVKITIPEADEILKGCFCYVMLLIVKLELLASNFFSSSYLRCL